MRNKISVKIATTDFVLQDISKCAYYWNCDVKVRISVKVATTDFTLQEIKFEYRFATTEIVM
jgi:hypothetical protein